MAEHIETIDNPMRAGNINKAKRPARKAHKKPSVAEAMRIRLLLHPSYIPPGGTAKDRRMYGCCAPTGRFFFRSCEKCDPFCEGRVSSFAALGSGPTSYWKNLKLLLWSFFIMTLFVLPALVINTFNKGDVIGSSGITLVQTTLAGLAPVGGNETAVATVTSVRLPMPGGSVLVLARDKVAMIYSLCDLGASLVFLLAFLYNRSFSKREERQVDKSTVSATDYTVFLPWVPRDTTEADVTKHFKQLTTTELSPEGLPIAEIHLVEDNTAVVSIFVERGRVFRQIERLQERIGRLEEAVRLGHLGCTLCFGGVPGQVTRLKRFRDLLSQRAEQLSKQATLRASKGAVAAFVTFEDCEAVDFVLSQYPNSLPAWCCQARAKRLNGKRIEVLPAPPPASVLWSNLAVGNCEQRTRQTFTGILTAAFLVGSFILLWFASWKQEQFSAREQVTDCTTPALLARISAGQLNSTYASTLPAHHPDLFCYCGTLPWSSIKYVDMEVDPWAPKCPSFSCPAYFSQNPGGIGSLPYCLSFIQDKAAAVGLIIAASFAIIFINSAIAIIMRLLTALEAHKSFEDLNASLQLRLFFAQFFNTALLMILVNVAWPGTASIPEEFKTGKWSDLTSGWYASVGVQLIITMIINVVTPHVYGLITAAMMWMRVRSKHQDAPSQRDLNDRFVGPYADWSLRYAQLANVMTVCFVFSTGMPLLLPVGLVSFLVSYWVDKIMFLWYFRRPPTFGSSVQMSFVSLMPLALVLHLGWGAWAISYGPLLDWSGLDDPLRVQKYVGMASSMIDSYAPSVVTAGAGRLTKLQALPLFVLFVVMVAAMFLQLILGSLAKLARGVFNFITCGACARVDISFGEDHARAQATYSDACDPALVGKGGGTMSGLPSYNILLNPEIMSAFAISPEWAASHKTLSEVALYKIGNASMAKLPIGSPSPGVSIRGLQGQGQSQGQVVRSAAAELAVARARQAQAQRGDGFGDGGGGYGFSDYDDGGLTGPLDVSATAATGSAAGGEAGGRADTEEVTVVEEEGGSDDEEEEYIGGRASAATIGGPGGYSDWSSYEEVVAAAEAGNEDAIAVLEAMDDQELGGFLAGHAPSQTASTRRIHVNSSYTSFAYTQAKQASRRDLTSGMGMGGSRGAAALPGVFSPPPHGRPKDVATAGAGAYATPSHASRHLPPPPRGHRSPRSPSAALGGASTDSEGLALVQQAAEEMQGVVLRLVGDGSGGGAGQSGVVTEAELATTAGAMLILLRQRLAALPANNPRTAELAAAVAHLSSFVTLEALLMDTSARLAKPLASLVQQRPAMAPHSPPNAALPTRTSAWAQRTSAASQRHLIVGVHDEQEEARAHAGHGAGQAQAQSTVEGITVLRIAGSSNERGSEEETPVAPYVMSPLVEGPAAGAGAVPVVVAGHAGAADAPQAPPPPPPSAHAAAAAVPVEGQVVVSALHAAAAPPALQTAVTAAAETQPSASHTQAGATAGAGAPLGQTESGRASGPPPPPVRARTPIGRGQMRSPNNASGAGVWSAADVLVAAGGAPAAESGTAAAEAAAAPAAPAPAPYVPPTADV